MPTITPRIILKAAKAVRIPDLQAQTLLCEISSLLEELTISKKKPAPKSLKK